MQKDFWAARGLNRVSFIADTGGSAEFRKGVLVDSENQSSLEPLAPSFGKFAKSVSILAHSFPGNNHLLVKFRIVGR
jgi:hypothetical protein